MEGCILRGKVTSYPEDAKGLVEVAIGAWGKEGDKVLARVEPCLSGVYWLPEIGDVVEVALPPWPGGDARVVHVRRREGDGQVEGCWSDQNNQKQLKTRSGHTVTLDDTQDGAFVTLSTAGGLTLRLDDGAKTITLKKAEGDTPSLTLDTDGDQATLSAGKGLTLSCGGAELSIDDQGNVTLSTNGDLTLSGKTVTLKAKTNFSAQGQQAEVKGSVSAAVSGQSRLELSSDGIAQVKGSMVKLN